MMGNDELCHPQDPKGGQEPVRPRQFSFLQLLLPGRAPLPLRKAKLAFRLPWLQLSCADALWSHVLWRVSKHEMCPRCWLMGRLQTNAFAKADATAHAGYVSVRKT